MLPVRGDDTTDDYGKPTFSELEEMALDEEDEYVVDYHTGHIWEFTSGETSDTLSEC